MRFSPDGKTLAASGRADMKSDTSDMPCDIISSGTGPSGPMLHTLSGHTNNIYALAFSPDGKTLASGSMDQTVKLWDTATGQLRETIVPQGRRCYWA